jgi:hypothetical protein
MQLDDFVFETLKQLVDGVSRAKEYGAQKGAKVNPDNVRWDSRDGLQTALMYDQETLRPIHSVEFDVAVTTTEGTQDKVGAGIFVAAIGLGAQGQSKSENQSVSRIKFSVPVLYP